MKNLLAIVVLFWREFFGGGQRVQPDNRPILCRSITLCYHTGQHWRTMKTKARFTKNGALKLTQTITCCQQCPYVTNDTIEHDDPFTSPENSDYWWCSINQKVLIHWKKLDQEIHPDCPLRT